MKTFELHLASTNGFDVYLEVDVHEVPEGWHLENWRLGDIPPETLGNLTTMVGNFLNGSSDGASIIKVH